MADMRCACARSRQCLEGTCECFISGKHCNDACSCMSTSCSNTRSNEQQRSVAVRKALRRNPEFFRTNPSPPRRPPACACVSNSTSCLGGQCSCYREGFVCSHECGCHASCANFEGSDLLLRSLAMERRQEVLPDDAAALVDDLLAQRTAESVQAGTSAADDALEEYENLLRLLVDRAERLKGDSEQRTGS